MRNKILKTTWTTSIITICAVLSLIGCASTDSKDQESMLSAAGFRAHTPDTPQQIEAFEKLPPYKVQRIHDSSKDKTIYVYKDKKQGVAYVGSEDQYQRYKQLAVQKDIAEDYYNAAELNRQASLGWYGAWPNSYRW